MKLVKRAKDSFNARIVYPHQEGHFKNTKWGQEIRRYRGRYEGQRCFFIGNGPSLKAEDLTRLYGAGEVTFAFNRIFNIFADTPWRPTFYISQDEKMLGGCVPDVNMIPAEAKFIPIQMKWWHGISVEKALYFNIVHQPGVTGDSYLFSDDISKGIYNSATGMYTAAQIAAYMGFSEIYLIGVDHHFRISRNNNGEVVVDDSVKDYFSDKYNEDKDKLYVPNTENSTLTYEAMKIHLEKRGINIYNATRGGRLEVFPRVEFDKAVKRKDTYGRHN